MYVCYVCMDVCMYVYSYVCMHVCMPVLCMCICMYVCMHACMCVCCVCIQPKTLEHNDDDQEHKYDDNHQVCVCVQAIGNESNLDTLAVVATQSAFINKVCIYVYFYMCMYVYMSGCI